MSQNNVGKGQGEQFKAPDTMLPALEQDNRMPPKKRSLYQEQDIQSLPRKEKKTPLERLEARRKSNRLSAQRARIRTKEQIQKLEDGTALLREINKELCIQLEQALSQNCSLKRLMNAGASGALGRSRALSRALELRAASQNSQNSQNVLNRMATNSSPSPLSQLAEVANAPSFEPTVTRRSPEPVIDNDHSTANASMHFQPHERTPVEIQIMYLQQEIRALKNKVQRS